MQGNVPVQFLGGERGVIPSRYPTDKENDHSEHVPSAVREVRQDQPGGLRIPLQGVRSENRGAVRVWEDRAVPPVRRAARDEERGRRRLSIRPRRLRRNPAPPLPLVDGVRTCY